MLATIVPTLAAALAEAYGYQGELPLFDEQTCAQLVAALVAAGKLVPPALTLAEVGFVLRCQTVAVRSCSTAPRYDQADYTATAIVAVEAPEQAAGDTWVTIEQIGEAAAHRALLDRNRQRLSAALLAG